MTHLLGPLLPQPTVANRESGAVVDSGWIAGCVINNLSTTSPTLGSCTKLWGNGGSQVRLLCCHSCRALLKRGTV